MGYAHNLYNIFNSRYYYFDSVCMVMDDLAKKVIANCDIILGVGVGAVIASLTVLTYVVCITAP